MASQRPLLIGISRQGTMGYVERDYPWSFPVPDIALCLISDAVHVSSTGFPGTGSIGDLTQRGRTLIEARRYILLFFSTWNTTF